MKGLRLTRRGKIVGLTMVLAAGAGIGIATAPYAWNGHGYSKIDTMPACVYEDGSGGPLPCRWDAGSMGNGQGVSYWVEDLGDQVWAYHYDDGHTEIADLLPDTDD